MLAATSKGPIDPHVALAVLGIKELQRYLVDKIQEVYRSQSVATISGDDLRHYSYGAILKNESKVATLATILINATACDTVARTAADLSSVLKAAICAKDTKPIAAGVTLATRRTGAKSTSGVSRTGARSRYPKTMMVAVVAHDHPIVKRRCPRA